MKVLDKIMERCTGKEINILMYISQFQDECGVIRGIDYKDILGNMFISKSGFYKCLYSLERKEIIEIMDTNEHSFFWDIKIIDNTFTKKEEYKKGYLNINNYRILNTIYFQKMTKSEKVIVLNLLKMLNFKGKILKISYNTLIRWTNKSMRSIKKFVCTLKEVIALVESKSGISIDLLKVYAFAKNDESEKDIFNRHLLKYKLKLEKTAMSRYELEGIIKLFTQYNKLEIHKIWLTLDSIIKECAGIPLNYASSCLSKLLREKPSN